MKFLFILSLFSIQAFAGLDYDETVAALKENKNVKCSFAISYLLQTKEGHSTPDKEPAKKVLIDNAKTKASSSSDFATYSLEWENSDFSFYYFMNSQIGEIRIEDKNSGYSSEVSLDIYDMIKDRPYIGSATLQKVEDLLVTSPFDNTKKVPGEMYTYLEGTCHKLKRYIP